MSFFEVLKDFFGAIFTSSSGLFGILAVLGVVLAWAGIMIYRKFV